MPFLRPAGLLAGLLASVAAHHAPAHAIYLTESNGAAYLSGAFDRGDEVVFAKFLAQPRARPIRTIWLDSRGGTLVSAMIIGMMARRARLTTAMRADSGVCDSACTLVFAGGVRRHYVNGNSVFEGLSSQSGLGFHGANIRGNAAQAPIKSNTGTALMNRYYATMGMPAVANLIAQSAINTVYRPSGATALRLRIATSLAEP
jgi:hypothetical protein